MLLNDAKEQIFGPRLRARKAWSTATGRNAEAQVKDLGVYHYGHGYAHPVMDQKIKELRLTAERIGAIPTERHKKANIAAAVIFGKCLYGQEVHYITQKHYDKLSSLMVTAMGEKYTRRPKTPFLLHTSEGKYEPSVCRIGRLVRHWVKHVETYNIPQGYWNHCLQSAARAGPIHIVAQALKQQGIHARGPALWEIDGILYDLRAQHGVAEAVQRKVTDGLWEKLGTKRRNFQGLQKGRNHQATLAWGSQIKEDRTKAFLDTIMTDAVYTPHRAHLRWGKPGHCPICKHPQGDWRHYVNDCPGISHRAKCPAHFPDCLKYTGTVPYSWARRQSAPKWEKGDLGPGPTWAGSPGGRHRWRLPPDRGGAQGGLGVRLQPRGHRKRPRGRQRASSDCPKGGSLRCAARYGQRARKAAHRH